MPFSIAIVGQFSTDDTLFIDDNEGRVGEDSLGFRIAETIGINGFPLGIRQEREFDFRPLSKAFERLNFVTGNANDLDPGILQRFRIFLQLDQLLFAEWSPIR